MRKPLLYLPNRAKKRYERWNGGVISGAVEVISNTVQENYVVLSFFPYQRPSHNRFGNISACVSKKSTIQVHSEREHKRTRKQTLCDEK
jgi:hypothetical protein